MGTHKTAIWVALFALIANASSGVGLELALPSADAQGATVCEAQSVIATMLVRSSSSDVCRLQSALDFTGDAEDRASDLAPSPLFGAVFHDRSPVLDSAALAANFALWSLTDMPEVDPTPRAHLDFFLPPGSLQTEQSLHALLTPNGPPALV